MRSADRPARSREGALSSRVCVDGRAGRRMPKQNPDAPDIAGLVRGAAAGDWWAREGLGDEGGRLAGCPWAPPARWDRSATGPGRTMTTATFAADRRDPGPGRRVAGSNRMPTTHPDRAR